MSRSALLVILLGILTSPLCAFSTTDTPPNGVAERDLWRFRVMLDERDIGYHEFEVNRRGETEEIRIEARFKVKLLFITAYEYEHDNLERWSDGCLQRISSSTDDNGDRFQLDGSDEGVDFDIILNAREAAYPLPCVQTFAYWNPNILRAKRLLNAQTGLLQDVAVDFRGAGPVQLGERTFDAKEYVVSTDGGDITLWYENGSGRWLGLETLAGEKRVLRYVPEQLPLSDGNGRRLASNP